ncbi:TPA: DUF4148 domain-containing protein [Burkholderia vietnamiensis]|nr:DUF4148 domain-containing protein [Burkholderia vietnamiensis]
MNRRMIAAALLALTIGTPVAAFAQSASAGLTRADVLAELVQAQRDGTVPTSRWDYPPSAPTIERNRELYALGHGEQHTQSAAAGPSGATGSAL